MRFTTVAAATTALLLLLPLSAPAPAQTVNDQPPAMEGQAASLLPPGNSGTVTTAGQAEGSGGGSFGPNTDDQTDLYWGLQGYATNGFADPAAAVRTETLRDGAVRIYWDAFGVPAIYGDTGEDVWFGAGYAIAQIRLFLMDAVRRQGRGTFAALVGPSGVPLDVQTRTLTYSDEEYQAIFDGLSPQAKDAFGGYVDGANLWIEQVNSDPSLLPVEYGLLSTQPEPLTVIDTLAAGVLITRTVASEGGQEMDNVRLLRDLEDTYGEEAGRGIFNDLVWQDDPLAITTVPREEGVFPNSPLIADAESPAAQEDGAVTADEALAEAAEFAATLPLSLADGPGTGAFPAPPATPIGGFASGSGGSGSSPDVSRGAASPGGWQGPVPAAIARPAPVTPRSPDPGSLLAASVADALVDHAESLHGGSIALAIGPGRTDDQASLLLSGPQLGYSYPSLLVELEVHGGGYDARGASVPALPTVGIGYTDRVAWALTTGYSKTIDSFIETVRGTPGVDLEHFHDGVWKPVDCRTETVSYRAAQSGLPVGPAAQSVDVEACRTVHGPIVSMEDGDGERLARAVQYQMFMEEADTVEGVLAWNRARNFDDFEEAMRQVTWNENTTYADADGRIAYWHPGIHRERPAVDLRLPMPGDGSADFGEVLPFESLPHAVDPAQGFLANWNNKPAHDWLDGVGLGNTSRPGGAFQRVTVPVRMASSRDDHTFATLQSLEMEAGLVDVRAEAFLPMIIAAAQTADDADVRDVADLLMGWNHRFYDPPGAPTTFDGPGGESDVEGGTDGPGATVFEAVVEQMLLAVFDDEWDGRPTDPDVAAACNSAVPGECPDLFSRQLGVGGHRYDHSPTHNLMLRVLDPSSSGLTPSRDYLGGRDRDQLIRDAIGAALDALEAEYGSSIMTAYRRPTHMSQVNSLTGVTGPSSTQPYQDRGSYIHVVGFDGLDPVTAERAAGDGRVGTSVAASAAAFPDGAETVVIAPGGDHVPALVGAPLAGLSEAPVLLVDGRAAEAASDSDASSDPEAGPSAGAEPARGSGSEGGCDGLEETSGSGGSTSGGSADGDASGAPQADQDGAQDAAAVLGCDVALELQRLGATTAIVIADQAADAQGLPGSVDQALQALGLTVDRIGGTGPFELSVAVADRVADLRDASSSSPPAGSPDAYVVSAEAFPDAVSIAGVAARTGVPILLVSRDEVPAPTLAFLGSDGASQTVVVGGPAVVSDDVLEQLPSASRLAGLERYATAAEVLRHARSLGLSFNTLVVATGATFPDSLAGAPLAAMAGGVVVLADGLSRRSGPLAFGEAVQVALSQRAFVRRIVVLGGDAVIGAGLRARLG